MKGDSPFLFLLAALKGGGMLGKKKVYLVMCNMLEPTIDAWCNPYLTEACGVFRNKRTAEEFVL